MKTILLLTLILTSALNFAQNSDEKKNKNSLKGTPFKERIYTNFDIGANTNSSGTFINISPSIGYKITKPWSVGMGIKYQYYFNRNTDYSDHIFGSSVFTKYLIGDYIVTHAEFEVLNARDYNNLSPTYGKKVLVPVFMIGGGIRYNSLHVLLLYDLIDDSRSPYRHQYYIPGIPLILRAGVSLNL